MVKDEYKETDKGAIPCEWDITTLGQIGDPKMCKRVLKEQTATQGEIPFFKIGTFGRTPDAFISRELFENFRSRFSYPRKGDILLSAAGTIGRTVIFDGKDAYFQDSNIVWIDNDEQKVTNEYLYYVYDAIKWKTADGGTVSRLYNELLKSTPIVLPPIDEQKAIATALSDVDELIANLKKLIEKKEAIKQGVMQELLTGKRRLPGFSGEWHETTLSDLCYLITKQTGFDYSATIKPSLTTSQEQNMYSFIQNKDFCGYDVNYDTDFYIPKVVAETFPRILLSEPCLLVSISGRIGNVAYFQNEHTAFAGGAVGIAKFKDTSLIEWCMLYLQSDAGQKQIFLNEKVGAQHNLTVADVRDLQIMLPDVEERLAIQNAIRDMDKDILLIEEKLQKYKYLKQAMMQKLLTGEIRLV